MLAVNLGNSNCSFALFEGTRLLRRFDLPSHEVEANPSALEALLSTLPTETGPKPSVAWLCSVVPSLISLVEAKLEQAGFTQVKVITHADLPFTLRYSPPEACGLDRLVNLAAAEATLGAPCAVVDAGTAITVDVLDAERVFRGGAILPGAGLAFKALIAQTAQLPPVELELPPSPLGSSTRECLQAGLLYGVAGALDRLLEEYEHLLGVELPCLVTGGEARLVKAASHKLAAAALRPNLTLEGLALLYVRSL